MQGSPESTQSSPDRVEFYYVNASILSPQKTSTPCPKKSADQGGRLARSEAPLGTAGSGSFPRTPRILNRSRVERRKGPVAMATRPPRDGAMILRTLAIEEVQHGQAKLQQLKSLPMTDADRLEQTAALITTITHNMKKAFIPDPTQLRFRIQPHMVQMFDDVVSHYAEQVQENARLVSNMNLMMAQLPADAPFLNHQAGAGEIARIVDPGAEDGAWLSNHRRFGYRTNNESIDETDSSESPSEDKRLLLSYESDRDADRATAQHREAKVKEVHISAAGRALAARPENTGEIYSAALVKSNTLQDDLDNAQGEIESLQQELEASRQVMTGLQEELDRMTHGQHDAGNRDGHQNVQGPNEPGDFQRLEQTPPEIARVRNRLDEIQKRLKIDRAEERGANLAGSDRVPVDNSPARTMEDELAELRHEVDRLREEILGVRRERDESIVRAERADKKALELKRDATATPLDAGKQIAALRQDIRGRDRQINDLLAVRSNLRLEVIRLGGRVVGSRGEVTRERFDPVRWDEAGRREREGLPRIYRDAWGPDGDANIPRDEWPAEYQPDIPEPMERNDGGLLDEVMRREITAAYHRVRELFPEMESRGRETLAGLMRIFRDERQRAAEEVAGLLAKNEAQAEIRDRLRAEVRRCGGRVEEEIEEPVQERPLPAHSQAHDGDDELSLPGSQSGSSDRMSIEYSQQAGSRPREEQQGATGQEVTAAGPDDLLMPDVPPQGAIASAGNRLHDAPGNVPIPPASRAPPRNPPAPDLRLHIRQPFAPANLEFLEATTGGRLGAPPVAAAVPVPAALPATPAVPASAAAPATVAANPGRGRGVRSTRNPAPKYCELSPRKRKASSSSSESKARPLKKK
jgi:hypothetical protein